MTPESPAEAECHAWLAQGETKDRFLVAGRHAVEALLASDFGVDAILATGAQPESVRAAADRGVPVIAVSRPETLDLLGYTFRRGVMAVARKPPRDFARWAGHRDVRRLAILDRLADPGNVGTIIRNAAAFGFDAVICTRSGASPYNGKAVRASATALFRMPVFVEDAWDPLVKEILPGLTLIGTDVSAAAMPLAEFSQNPPSSLGVVFGSEAEGLSAEALMTCEHRLHIPISDRVESLNVASASAILLHALRA